MTKLFSYSRSNTGPVLCVPPSPAFLVLEQLSIRWIIHLELEICFGEDTCFLTLESSSAFRADSVSWKKEVTGLREWQIHVHCLTCRFIKSKSRQIAIVILIHYSGSWTHAVNLIEFKYVPELSPHPHCIYYYCSKASRHCGHKALGSERSGSFLDS